MDLKVGLGVLRERESSSSKKSSHESQNRTESPKRQPHFDSKKSK